MKKGMPQMCVTWAEKLAACDPEDLSSAQHAELEIHLKNCSTCAIVYAEYRLMDTLIRAYPACDLLPSIPPLSLNC